MTGATLPIDDGVVIRTEGLTKVYDTGVKAVDRLDLEVHEGEIFGFLGPNGAGKTTTVGMLTTRVIPTEGHATVAGVDVVAHPSEAKALMGVVSQTNTLDRSLTVWENLYFHGRYFGMGKKDSKRVATQMLEVFRLADRADADVATLSGGMAQRLMVARSIVAPSAHAVPGRADVRPGPAIADRAVGDHPADPRRRADRRAHDPLHGGGRPTLRAGRDHGPREAAGARHPRRAEAIGRRRFRREDQGRDRNPTTWPRTCTTSTASRAPTVIGETVQLTAKGSEGLLPRIIATAEAGGFHVHDVSIDEPTLETVFINLTGKDLRE